MELISALKKVYADCGRTVMIADKNMNVVWSNHDGSFADLSADKLHAFDGKTLKLPLREPVTVGYSGMFGSSCAVEIQPLDEGETGYLLQFYSCDDIERLSDRSDHLKFKSNFLGNIRNELSHIVFLLDSNRQKYVDSGDLDYLQLDREARYRILRTFSATANLNELTKYYNGFFKTEPLSVSDVLEDLCREISEQFEASGCKFTFDIAPAVYAVTNADRLRAAVCNLLINGYMYNDSKDKQCRLELSCSGGTMTITIKDNGAKASADELERCKKPFGAFKSFGEHESLGISVAALYCSSLGGELRFECKSGEYTKAVMSIPVPDNEIPHEFRIGHVPPITSPYDLQYCILAKGIDPMK